MTFTTNQFNQDQQTIFRGALAPKERETLEALEKRAGHILSRKEILDAIDAPLGTSDRTIDQWVCRINNKATSHLEKYAIEGINHLGYIAVTVPMPPPLPHERIDLVEGSYIDTRNLSLINGAQSVRLTLPQYKLAREIFENPTHVISNAMIGNLLGTDKNKSNATNVHLCKLRDAFESVSLPRTLIKNVHGIGLQASDEVQEYRKNQRRQKARQTSPEESTTRPPALTFVT